MAAKSRSLTYFPDVRKCLSGSQLAWSWDDFFTDLFSHDESRARGASEVLSNDQPKDILSPPFPLFPEPTASSKSAFDAAVSTIPTSPDGLYNKNELSEDALWLSKQVNLSEHESLRLTLLEWQQRPESRLCDGYSEAEVASLKGAVGSDYLDRQWQAQGGTRARDDVVFASQTSRRARLISLHLSQQVLVLRLKKELVDVSLRPLDKGTAIPQPCIALATRTRPDLADLDMDVSTSIERIQTLVKTLESDMSWDIEESERTNLSEDRDSATLQMIEAILDILLLMIGRPGAKPEAKSDRLWFELMSNVGFFSSFNSQIEEQSLAIRSIQSTASLVTVILLRVGSAVTELSRTAASDQTVQPGFRSEYFFDPEIVSLVHELLLHQAAAGNIPAGPAILAWAIIVNHIQQLAQAIKERNESQHVQRTLEGVATFDAATGRRASGNTSAAFQTNIYEDLLDTIVIHSPHDDPSGLLLDAAIDRCNVVDYIALLSAAAAPLTTMSAIYRLQGLQEVVAVAQSFLGYTPELVSSQLALLAPTPHNTKKKLHDPVAAFVEDKDLLQGFYDVAAARFPYECLPFLRFSRALAAAAIFSDDGTQYVEYRLRTLTSFTQAVVKGISVRTTREDEHGSFVALNRSVNLLDLSQNKLLTYTHQDSESTSLIPADTVGELITDPDGAGPKVVRWQHEFSGLAYLGQLLEMHYMGLLSASLSQLEEPESVVSEIFNLLTMLLSTILENDLQAKGDETQHHCAALLDEFSRHLNPDADVTTYVFDILEQELQHFRRRTVSTFDCRIMTSCLSFIVVLSKVQSELIWSKLNRTSLLGHQSGSSPILAVVSGVEVALHSFDFLEKCTELYHALIGLALQQASVHAPASTVPLARSKLPAAWRIQSPMLMTATEVMYQVFQGMSDWVFHSPQQLHRISASITDSFSDIISYAFGVGASLDASGAAGAHFAEAATFLINAFRVSSSQDVGLDPIARALFAMSRTEPHAMLTEDGFKQCASSVLSLATLLVRYSQVRNLPLSSLEKNIFDTVPCLVRRLRSGSRLLSPCLKLLRCIIVYVEPHQSSSLLGHLGSSSCVDLLHVIRHLDEESESPVGRAELWKLLSLFVKESQQWLAMVVLTGSAPDGSKRTKCEEKPAKCIRGKTFLEVALNELSSIEDLPRKVAKEMLVFVLQAQQNWSWVNHDLSTTAEFLPGIMQFVTDPQMRPYKETELADENLIAALVTDVATTHLHYAKASRELNAILTYVPLMKWLASNAVNVSSYNISLHTNLRRNFSVKYDGFVVTDIQSTGLCEQAYGPSFFYDVEFADKLLENDASWNGVRGKASNQSFSAEFRRANANLSIVDSELALLSSLQRLCIEHCKFFVRDREVQKAMAEIVQRSLQANSQVYSTEALFDSLFQTRADLSNALLRELVAFGVRGSEFLGLLEHSWTAVRFRSGSYEQAIINNDLTYWRSVLSILLMTLQFHVNKKHKAAVAPGGTTTIATLDPQTPTFLEITSTIVTVGFRSVVVALQDQKDAKSKTDTEDQNKTVGLRDTSILLTLLQTMLRLPSLPQFATELSARLASSGIIASALVLYSWSHLLAVPETESSPRYAEHCVQLLASISSLEPVAEEIAIEGVLNRILSAKTTELLQRLPGGASHAESRPGCGFLYRVWAAGLLPLCLNLLHAVGGVIAPEISAFLNRFPDQLVRASTSLMPTPQTKAMGADILTLTVASEAATLALLSYGLSSYRNAGASAAVDPATIMPLTGYDDHRKAILEDIRDLVAMKEDARRRITHSTDEKELNWQSAREGDKLDGKIVRQLRIAVVALSREDDDDDEEK